MILRFSDGVNIDTGGELRATHLADGWYVVGDGMSAPCKDEDECIKLINNMKGNKAMTNQTGQVQASAAAGKQVTQGEAVVQAVRDVLKSDYKEGAKVILSEDQRKAVSELLVKGFTDRRIPLKPSPANETKLADPKQLQSYVKGLINNWLTKSPLLNGKPKKAKTVATPIVPTQTAAPELKTIPAVHDQKAGAKEAKVQDSPVKKPVPPAGKK